MSIITCARLDERGVFQGMAEVEEADALPPLWLPQILVCDLAAGEYRWQPEEGTPHGGAFVPLPRTQRAVAGRPTLEHALAFDLLARWERQEELTTVSLAWLDDALQTVDFGSVLHLDSVQAYGRARGLPFAKKEV